MNAKATAKWLGFSASTTAEHAIERFTAKYGRPPKAVIRNRGAVLAGPILEDGSGYHILCDSFAVDNSCPLANMGLCSDCPSRKTIGREHNTQPISCDVAQNPHQFCNDSPEKSKQHAG